MREATAFHEAGHAVAAHHHQIRIRKLSIVPEHDSHGHMIHRSPLAGINLEWDDTPKARIKTEHAIVVCLAGPIAQKQFRASSYRSWHGHTDHERAADLALRVCGSEQSTNAYLKWLHIQAGDMLTVLWPMVEVLAQELLLKGEIAGKPLSELLASAARRA